MSPKYPYLDYRSADLTICTKMLQKRVPEGTAIGYLTIHHRRGHGCDVVVGTALCDKYLYYCRKKVKLDGLKKQKGYQTTRENVAGAWKPLPEEIDGAYLLPESDGACVDAYEIWDHLYREKKWGIVKWYMKTKTLGKYRSDWRPGIGKLFDSAPLDIFLSIREHLPSEHNYIIRGIWKTPDLPADKKKWVLDTLLGIPEEGAPWEIGNLRQDKIYWLSELGVFPKKTSPLYGTYIFPIFRDPELRNFPEIIYAIFALPKSGMFWQAAAEPYVADPWDIIGVYPNRTGSQIKSAR